MLGAPVGRLELSIGVNALLPEQFGQRVLIAVQVEGEPLRPFGQRHHRQPFRRVRREQSVHPPAGQSRRPEPGGQHQPHHRKPFSHYSAPFPLFSSIPARGGAVKGWLGQISPCPPADPPKGTKKGRWSGALFWYKRNAFRLSQGEIHRFSGSISWVVTMFTLPLLSRIHAQTKISAVATTVPMASGSVRLVREKKPVISEVMMDTTIRNR